MPIVFLQVGTPIYNSPQLLGFDQFSCSEKLNAARNVLVRTEENCHVTNVLA